MKNVLARVLWLQNNNNNAPGPRQPNSMRPNQGPNGQPPQRGSSSLNRWLLVIVILMLGVYLFQFFNNANTNSTPARAELNYSDFYHQISSGNIKSATITGTTDITGQLCSTVTYNGNGPESEQVDLHQWSSGDDHQPAGGGQ